MGRTATFDRRVVIARARNIFWAKGYEATAVPDLEEATGLKRSSLYHAFGSKKGLFDEAIDSYLNEKVRPLIAPLKGPATPSDALARYFRELRDGVLSEDGRPGCLLVAAANAPVGADPVVASVIADYHAELLEAFTAGVLAAMPGLSAPQARSRARVLVALNISALALVRTNPALAAADLDEALALLND
ncbi:TetR/AcrR family transcriptional regulator [Schaalia hyovaginalis]|uniref:TetR/AcrR family transcriptional regulator n=1 Tax=Schaalia hyovaginalis TaxID=29316 RepID=UPI001F2A01CC|nr:TetR/AcrR family transcriptional regulator [Schaalia hyovaginalis]MCF2711030.1 TetR/AcrR family transcriptional regulator [Schaalia hyovaginalis]